MRLYKHLLLAGLAALMLASCGEEQPTLIKFVCTGDVHGNLYPHSLLTGEEVEGSLARVSSYLKEQRKGGADIVYIDNGDMLQGSPATYCYNTNAIGQTHVAAEALNYLGCEAVVLGNNDIETGGPTYQRYADDLEGVVLGGNVVFDDDGTPFLPPFTIVERGGMRIALMGLTTPAMPHWIPKCQWPELEFENMKSAARRWMQYLHETVEPDMVIGLFHSGYEGGIVTDEYAENATLEVARKVPGFDAIFYGHDHKARHSEVVNIEGDTVILLNPGKEAHQVATLDIRLDKNGKRTLNAALVDMDNYTPDEEYMRTFTPQRERVERYLNRVMGTSVQEADAREALFGPSALVDLIHQMQLEISGAKISFAAPLVDDYTLPEGGVTVGDVYRLLPYENFLYVLWLTGEEIKDYMEMSYGRWTRRMTSPNDHLLMLDSTGVELKHPHFYFDSAAGIIYEVDVTKPIGQRVTIKSLADGKPFGMKERYMVAMNSFRAHGGGGLLTEGAGITHEQMLSRIEYTTTADLRFYMLNYIEMKKNIAPSPLNQWKFVPERWTKGAIERDRELLLGEE